MKKKAELKFETSLKRLEEIVEVLESGGSELDESLKLFEEGIGLVRVCQGKLNEFKKKIEVLKEKNGELLPETFKDEE